MSGSLLRIIQSDPTDIFLTGNPTITYFKTVFRRYTNFSLDFKEEKFDNESGFGIESTLVIPKNADLMHRMYLKVTVPEFYISKSFTEKEKEDQEEKKTLYENAFINYTYIKKYLSYNYSEYRNIYNLYKVDLENLQTSDNYNNITTILKNWYVIIDAAEQEYNLLDFGDNNKYRIDIILDDDNFNNYINKIYNINITKQNKIINKRYIYSDDIGNINLSVLSKYMQNKSYETYTPINLLTTAYQACTSCIKKCEEMDKNYLNYLNNLKLDYENSIIPRYNFAWVDKLGHSIIEYVEFYIGGQQIDKQYGQWLDVWYEMNGDKKNNDQYYKLIGNVSELTTFNTDIKPEYTMYIPLNFWFCKNIALSLPLISLQFSSVIFKVKFRNFNECAYTSLKYTSDLNNFIDDENQNDLLDNILIKQNKNLTASLLIEYVYLDDAERRLFAKSSHEYLIEQTQIQQTQNLKYANGNMVFNFMHPCKGFIWFAQYTKDYLNIDNTNKCLWTDYKFKQIKEIKEIINGEYKTNQIINYTHPFKECELTIEGKGLTQKLSNIYYNYVQSWKVFKNTPEYGLNSYWFSLFPNEIQPSSFCNISYVREFKLNYLLNVENIIDAVEPYTLTVFALNYNILRISAGMGSIAYI